jgi:hypothetical protein
MKEPLRAKLEGVARRRGVSMNAEIVHRLERSLEPRHEVLDAAEVAFELYQVMRELGSLNSGLINASRELSSVQGRIVNALQTLAGKKLEMRPGPGLGEMRLVSSEEQEK